MPAPLVLTREEVERRLRGADVRALDAAGRRHAAVALTLTEEGHGADLAGFARHDTWSPVPAVMMTRRAEGLRSHAGRTP